MKRLITRAAPALLGLSLWASAAHAQKLTVQGDRFAVDGTPRFLVFISYFQAMSAPNVTADLHLLKSLGFDGLRIWPNVDTGPQLMNSDGSLKPDSLTRLLSILDTAKAERLIVDVTFTHEHIAGMSPEATKIGIVNATNALRSYDNVLFDIQNERNVTDRRFMSESDAADIYRAIKAADPARIATASLAPEPARSAADSNARVGGDVTAYHDPRGADWYQLDVVRSVVNDLKTNGKPVYLQEPTPTRNNGSSSINAPASIFLQAMANAKLSGAAAWCFHTREGVNDWRSGPAFFEDRLRSHPEPEWAFVTALNARVVLRAGNGNHFVVAEGGGGGGVRVDRTASGPGSWEVFGVTTLSGGALLSGDRVAFATADGHYLQAVNGGGGPMRGTATTVGAFETFTIEKRGGGVIDHGDGITLRAGNYFVVAEGGGGTSLSANSVAAGSWETFTILFVTPHVTDASRALSTGKQDVKKQ